MGSSRAILFALGVQALSVAVPSPALARPRYRQNLKAYYGEALPRSLDACLTCHQRNPRPEDKEGMPPHNPFGARLREVGSELRERGKPWDLSARLRAVAAEDADGDRFPNEIEILSGHAPGDPQDAPGPDAVRAAEAKARELEAARPGYSWEPLRPVARPAVPAVKDPSWVRNPVDAFIAREREERGLRPRPEAAPHLLLRRLYLDLLGLPPSPEELRSFLADPSPDAFEKEVDRLLSSPHYGERWGRHWMDVWRYSDWAGWGNQVRDSQPHIWRWRDWIVESLNADLGYDRMVLLMLAADELLPGDRGAARATGYLVRNFKLLSREAWMQETVDHASQAFLGLTMGCARCHDHLFDPISQKEYYRLRAVFEPYQVRLDRVPGEPDTAKDGLARAFDGNLETKTYLYLRGDDRQPDRDHPLAPGVPEALGGPEFRVEPVALPLAVSVPAKEEFVIRETIEAGERAVPEARAKFEAALLEEAKALKALASAPAPEKNTEKNTEKSPEKRAEKIPTKAAAEQAARKAREEVELAEMALPLAEAERDSLRATIRVEEIEDSGRREQDPEGWKKAALEAGRAQRWLEVLSARRSLVSLRLAAEKARSAGPPADGDEKAKQAAAKKIAEELAAAEKKLAEGEKRVAKAREDLLLPPSTDYRKRDVKVYPRTSSGRRLALARWIADRQNPLAARVAVNHLWLRHFGQAIVPSVSDFGQNGRAPTHPALLDWLAAELMEPSGAPAARPWSMKAIHRLLLTSNTYRMASTPDPASLALDPDNRWYWRRGSRRLEAEVVRDCVLAASGQLDATRGGPELDQNLILSTRRRSIYYRHAAEKQPEFLKIFDMAGVSECYERKCSIVPQQALALANSELVLKASRHLARALSEGLSSGGTAPEAATFVGAAFVGAAFERVLARSPTPEEAEACRVFLDEGEKRFGSTREKLTSAAPGGSDSIKPSSDPALRARENLVHVLLNHHDFVTVR